MALFKIAKGNSANLETNRPTRQEGFIYLTQDDMKFHVDLGNGSDTNLRRAINASQTDALRAWYTNPTDTAGRWTVTIDDLQQEDIKDGLTIRVRLSTSYNGTFNTLNVNGFGPKVVYYRQNSRLTSHVPQYAEVLLTYREPHQRTFNNVTYSIPGAANSDYINNNVNYGKSGWVLDASYSDGNNYERILNAYERRRVGQDITRYKLCMNDANGLLRPVSIGDTTGNTKTANTVPLDPSRIIYYSQSSTTTTFNVTGGSVLYEVIPMTTIQYTINASMPVYSDLYFVGTFNSDGLFVLDTNFYKIVTTPSSSSSPTLANNTFTQGKYYIYVGSTHSTANQMQLQPNHAIYYCEDSNGAKLQPVVYRPVYTRTSVGTIEHNSRTNEHLITKGALAYWNGAYSGTSSNLEYTKVGKLGSMATAKKGSWVVNRVAYAAADDQLNTASLLYTTGANLAVNKNSLTSGMTFEVNGKSTFYDDMYLSQTDDTAAESGSASFYLAYNNTSTSKSTSAVIRACGGGASATSGMLQVTSMGAVAITSGNAGGQLYSGNTDIAILSGAQIYLESNGITEANRIGVQIDANGNVLPVKKEAANTNAQSLGSSSARWKALYIGEGDTIGSANTPIYWYDGVPTPIDITLMNGTAGKLAYYSNATTLNQYTADVGSTRQIVYMNKGVPTAGNNTVAHLGNANKSNMNDIGKLWPSTGMTNLSDPSNNNDNPMNGTTKSTGWHLYWDTSYSDSPSGSNSWVAQIANKAGTDQWWVRSRSGSTITNGTAWASGWRHLVTSAQAGVGSGVKPIYINTSGEATVSAENIGSSLTPMYLEGGEFKTIGVSLNTSSAATKLAYYSATGTISGLTANVGSATQPVYIDAGYPKATTYSLNATINAGTANQVAYYSGANAISSKAPAWEEWVGGTSEGPKAKIQIGNASYTSGAIPSAGSNASGVVNTTVQTFGGNKTFANNVIINGTANFNNNTTTTGVATFNGNVVMNSSASADSLTAGSLVVNGNTSLVNTTNSANIMPHANNTYDIGSSSLKYANIYVTELHGNATTANAFSVNKQIALTGDVTGSASSTGGWSIATTIGNGKVTNAKLANSTMTIAGNSVSLGGSLAADTLRASLGLSNAMHFIGVATVAITDGSTTDPTISGYTFSNAKAGDVIIDANSAYEYVWSTAGKWERLGPDGSYKTVQTAVTSATAETTTATTFVYSVTQDANGVITVKTRPLPTYNNYSLPLAANGTRGGIQIGYSTSGKNYAVQLSSEKAYVNVPWTDQNVAQSSNTENKEFPVLLKNTNNTTNETAGTKYSGNITINPEKKTLTAAEFIGELRANKIIPTISKKYEDTSFYGTSDADSTCSKYFISVKPNSWYKSWTIRFKVRTYAPGYANVDSTTWCVLTGRADSMIYANWNDRYDIGHYYIAAHVLKKAGFDAGLGHAVGINIRYSTGRGNSAYYRTIELDYYDCDNCTVNILDTATLWSGWASGTDTNYNGYSNFNGVDRGLRESGDDNSTSISHWYEQYGGWVAGNNIKRYQFVFQQMPTNQNKFITLYETDNAYGTTNKTLLTTKFDPLGFIIYHNSSGVTNSGANIDPGRLYHTGVFDMRYTFNLTSSTATGTFTGVRYKPVYLQVTIDENGAASVASNQPLVNTLPTTNDGMYYIYLGQMHNWYQIYLMADHPVYYHNGTELVRYYGKTIGGKAVSAAVADSVAWGNVTGKPSSYTPSSHPHGNITNAGELGTASRAVVTDANKKITVADLTVSSATAETSTATTFVYSVTQSAQGKITVKTRPLPTYNNYEHPTGDGNLHVPATGTDNNGKFLKAGSTAGSISWAKVTWSDIDSKPSSFTPSSHTHYELATIGDQRTTVTTPNTYKNRFIFQGLKNNSAIGSPYTDTYSYLIGLRGWSDSSGGNAHELAFNTNGMYRRQGATDTWGNWYHILDSGNTAAGTNNAATLTWNTTYIIAKINGTDIKFTTMAKPTKSDVGLGNVENTALSTWTGSSNITTVGTITSGTWNGTAIAAAYIGSHSHGDITNDGKLTNANRLVWTDSNKKVYAGYHYASSTKVAINSYSEPTENFYVSGKVQFNIGTSDGSSSKNFIIYGNSRAISIGAQGIQAYTTGTTVSTLYLQNAGGNLQIGTSSTSTATRDMYGQFDFKSSTGFNYSGIGAGSENTARPIWFSYCSSGTIVTGRPVYDNDFKYNPSTNVMNIGKLTVTGGTDNSSLKSTGTLTVDGGSTVYINSASGTSIIFRRNNSELARFAADTDSLRPGTNNYLFGTSDYRWKIYASYLNVAGDVLVTGITTFNGNVEMNSSASIDSLTAGSLIVNGNTSLVNTTNAGDLMPHATTTYNIGSSTLKYSNVYATTFNGNATSATKATQDSDGNTINSTYIKKSVLSGAYDIMYSSAANTPTRLAANTTTTKKFLRMTGTGSAGAAPAWDTVTKSDVGLSNVTNDAQIAKSVLSGAYDILYSSAANTPARLAANTTTTKKFLRMTGTGSAGAAPAWDTVTKSDVGLSNVTNDAQIAKSVLSGAYDLLYSSAANTPSRLAANTTTTKKFLTMTGTGSAGAAPVWNTIVWDDVGSKPSSYTPSSHAHGNITNAGELDTASYAVVTDANKKIIAVSLAVSSATAETTTATTFVYSVTQDAQGKITVKTRPLPTYNNYEHPTGDGNLHVPTTGTSNNGKFLKAGSTAGSISWQKVTWSDIDSKPSSYTPSSHTHGNIQNGGTLQTNDITIANGDKLIVTDSSDSSKVARTSIAFDASTTTQALTKKGTWENVVNSVAGNTGVITADTLRTSLGLSNAMHFIGVATVAITDGSTTDPTITNYDFTNNKKAGDVIVDSSSAYEYVWTTAGKWERLGPDGSYKTTQTAITNSTGTADGTNTANTFVYSFSQDANGVVSVKTRPLSLAANGTRGGIQIGYSESGTNYAVKLSSEKAYVTVPWTDTKVTSAANHYTPSRDTNADKSASASGATAAWSIDVVKGITVQTDGKGHVTGVTVTSGKIPGNPNTDAKVKQSASTSDKWRKILLHYTEDTTSTASVSDVTNQVYASQKVAVSPNEGKLRATEFNVDDHVRLHYDSTTASLQFIFE